MANRNNTFLIKRSNTPGKVPTSGDLLLGELALNTADVILYASGTTANSILPIGWDRVARTGDTMTGTLYAPSISATTISATTYYGLPTDVYVTGGTYNTGTTVFTNNTGGTFSVTGYNTGLTNALSTGVYVFTGMTSASTSTFTVSPVSALIVDGTTNPLTPVVLPVYYSGGTHTVTNLSSATETYILLTSGATILQQTTFPTDTQRRQNVFLGKIGHANKSSIINVFNQPDFLQSPLAQLRDMFAPIGFINGGVYPSANGANLSFNTSAGEIHGLGVNYVNDTLKPDSLSVAAQSPVTFQYRTQTGGTATNTTLIDPTIYDLNGVATVIPGTKATNQRIYLVQNGVFRVQYGQYLYSNLAAAITGIRTETFITFPNFTDNALLIGVLSVESNATDLSDSSKAQFFFASKFGETIGAAAGFSTTTLQQAYNNSTNPEIVTSVAGDGVQFRGGTGSDLDANIIIENNAGNATGRWNANGGLSATTISATTYYGLPTDVYVTGGTYNTGTATFTNNTGGTFTVTGFSTSNATQFTGGTVTGATNFTNGLTANTISATTYYGDGSNLTGIVASWDGQQVITVGENVIAGDLLYLSGDSKYYKVNNLLESKSSTELRIAISAITANSTGSGLIQGEYTTTGLTAGAKYWVGSSGNFTSTQPSSDGSIVRYVGTALSTTKLEFNPDQTWLELATGTTVITTGSTYPTIREISTSQTALANDETLVCLAGLTLTIPSAVGIDGKTYYIKSRTSGTITINSTGGQTFDDDLTLTINVKNTSITIQSDGHDWILK